MGNAAAGSERVTESTFPQAQVEIHDALRPLLVERIGRLEGLSVLDAAAGSGYMTEWLTAQGARVTPVDMAQSGWLLPHVPLAVTDLNQPLPFDADRFDVAVSVETIEHLENPFQFLRELARVTKPGGLVVVTTPNVHSIRSRLKYLVCSLPTLFEYVADDNMGQHITPVSMGQFLYAFQRDGVTLEAVRSTGPRPPKPVAWIMAAADRLTRVALRRMRASRAEYPDHYLRVLDESALWEIGRDVSLIVVGRKNGRPAATPPA
jgi:ubiquinone/menaquinone biosynthesis C-methylase UbiE